MTLLENTECVQNVESYLGDGETGLRVTVDHPSQIQYVAALLDANTEETRHRQTSAVFTIESVAPDAPLVETVDAVVVRFYPEQSVEVDGRTETVPADDRAPVAYTVPRGDLAISPADGEEAEPITQQLQIHDNAPTWVHTWDGPFSISMRPFR